MSISVRKLVRKCAISAIKGTCILDTFTVSYVHPYLGEVTNDIMALITIAGLETSDKGINSRNMAPQKT